MLKFFNDGKRILNDGMRLFSVNAYDSTDSAIVMLKRWFIKRVQFISPVQNKKPQMQKQSVPAPAASLPFFLFKNKEVVDLVPKNKQKIYDFFAVSEFSI